MKIISANTGRSRTIEWNGKQVQTGIYKYAAGERVFLGTEDVENDAVMDRKHHGGTDKACYLYSADKYTFWQKIYPELEMPYGMFGENLTVEGLDESDIHIGDVLQAGDAMIQVTQPRQPCYKLGIRFGNQRVVKQFVESGFSGIYVRVLQTGFVEAGNKLICIEKKKSVSVKKVFELLYTSELRKDLLEKTLANPWLAESCRKDLLKRWKEYL